MTVPYILAKRHIHELTAFGSSNVLLAFDYDGTLAPIAAEPERAHMRATTRRLLTAVARRYPCAVISGRARRDLAGHMRGVPVRHLTGNHGLEPWGERGSYRRQVRTWLRQLRPYVTPQPGVLIEDKTYSLTMHYRHAERPRRALVAIRRGTGTLHGARVVGGVCAVSVIPCDAPDKGAALEHTRELLKCDRAIFVGDDETDEDVFALASDHVLTIRVGPRTGSRARFHLEAQADIDRLLRVLLACRA